MKTGLTALSLGFAIAAVIFPLVVPIHSGFVGNRATRATLVEVMGPWVIILIVFPVLAALLPLMFHKQAAWIIATVVICGFVLIGAFSIGLLYLPAAITMLLAICVAPSAKISDVQR